MDSLGRGSHITRRADLRPFPANLPPALAEAMTARGVTSLYSHQAEAWVHARAGENLVLATGTAGGKTLGYNLPVLSALLEDDDAPALYLFPTKALAQDQQSTLERLNVSTFKRANIQTAIYDGDTLQSHRGAIRAKSRIILTNPDMLHTGILPHHTNWAEFFFTTLPSLMKPSACARVRYWKACAWRRNCWRRCGSLSSGCKAEKRMTADRSATNPLIRLEFVGGFGGGAGVCPADAKRKSG